MTRVTGILFFWYWILTPLIGAQDIKPLGPTIDGVARFVDLAGLGRNSSFYLKDSLSMQLMEGLPVWTVTNLKKNVPGADYFNGLSEDGGVSARFISYIDPASGVEVVRGVVDDRSTETTYQVKRDGRGRDVVIKVRPEDLPPPGDSGVPLWGQISTLARNPWGVGKAALSSMGWKLNAWGTTKEERTRQLADIDIMIIWTPNAECSVSLEPVDCTLTTDTFLNMAADISLWVAETNSVHDNSDTGVTFNVVHLQRDTSGYRETDPSWKILCDLTNTCHWKLGYIHDLRNQFKADLVTLIADTIGISSDPVCGTAWYSWFSCLGFSVNDAACTNSGYTPAHEFGHNLGCAHDRGTASTQCGTTGACTDTCKSNYGYRVPGSFRTVMSYSCSSQPVECDGETSEFCPVIPYFSGEGSFDGQSLGGSENDCTSTINSNKEMVSNFR